MSSLNFFSGLAQGFVQSRDKKMQQEQNEELKKLQVKLFKKQLEEQEFRQGAQSKLMEMMSGAASPVPFEDTQGQAFADAQGQPGFESFQAQPEGLQAPGKPMSLTDVLADPQGQLAALQSGMFKGTDLLKPRNQGLEVLKALGFGGQPSTTAGAPSMGAGGMELTGVKIGPEGQVMPDFGPSQLSKERAKRQAELEAAEPLERAKLRGKGELTEFEKKLQKAENVTDLIGQAASLLDDATGSIVGTAVAAGKRFFGASDKTTQANQKLKLISGWMVSNVPRMEGPQSEFDVRNYQEMAGMVGDSTIPVPDRKAALQELLLLQQKYAGLNKGNNKPSLDLGKMEGTSKPSLDLGKKKGNVIDFSELPE